ncbi:MAG: PIN domain-containing protein [Fimbriimonadales bacterium]|nr:PIN domain-containing protein [Fimbriimonadales bacterium]
MVDTNILVYAYDLTEPDKRQIALSIVRTLAQAGQMVVSVQSLNEFYNTVTNPRKPFRIDHADAVAAIESIIAAATVLPLTTQVVRRALYGVERYQLAFWDALIWAAAREWNIPLLYTEDFSPGATIEGVQIVNPFTETA